MRRLTVLLFAGCLFAGFLGRISAQTSATHDGVASPVRTIEDALTEEIARVRASGVDGVYYDLTIDLTDDRSFSVSPAYD